MLFLLFILCSQFVSLCSSDFSDGAAAPAQAGPVISSTEGNPNPSMSSCGSAESGDFLEAAVARKKYALFVKLINQEGQPTKEGQLSWKMLLYNNEREKQKLIHDEQKEQKLIAKRKASPESSDDAEIEFLTIEQFSGKCPEDAVALMLDPRTQHLFPEKLKKELEPRVEALGLDDASDENTKKLCSDFMARQAMNASELFAEGSGAERDTAVAPKNALFIVDKEDQSPWKIYMYDDEQEKQDFIEEFKTVCEPLSFSRFKFLNIKQFSGKRPEVAVALMLDRRTQHFFPEKLKKRLKPIEELLRSKDFSDEKVRKVMSDFMAQQEIEDSELSADGSGAERDTAVARKEKRFFAAFINEMGLPDDFVYRHDNDEQTEQDFLAEKKAECESFGCSEIELLTVEEFSKKYQERAVAHMLDPVTSDLFSEELKKYLEPYGEGFERFNKKLRDNWWADEPNSVYEKIFFVLDDKIVELVEIPGAHEEKQKSGIDARVQEYKALGHQKIEVFSWEEFYDKYEKTFMGCCSWAPSLFKLELLKINEKKPDLKVIKDLLRSCDASDKNIEKIPSDFMAQRAMRASELSLDGSRGGSDTAVACKKNILSVRLIAEDQSHQNRFIPYYGDEQAKQVLIAECKAVYEPLGIKGIEFRTIEQFCEECSEEAAICMVNEELSGAFSEELKQKLKPIAESLGLNGTSDKNIQKFIAHFIAYQSMRDSVLPVDASRAGSDTAGARNRRLFIVRFTNRENQPDWEICLLPDHDEQEKQKRIAEYKASGLKEIEFLAMQKFHEKYPEEEALFSRKCSLVLEKLKEMRESRAKLLKKLESHFMAQRAMRASSLPAVSYPVQPPCVGTIEQEAKKRDLQERRLQEKAAGLEEERKRLEVKRLEHEKAEAEKQQREQAVAAAKQARREEEEKRLAEQLRKAAEQKAKELQANELKSKKGLTWQKNKEQMNNQFVEFKRELFDMQEEATNDVRFNSMRPILSKIISETTEQEKKFDACKGDAFKKQSETFEKFLAGFKIKIDQAKQNMDQAKKDFESLATNPKKSEPLAQAQDDDGDDSCLPQLQQQEQPDFLQQELYEKKSPVVRFGPAAPAQAGPSVSAVSDPVPSVARQKRICHNPYARESGPAQLMVRKKRICHNLYQVRTPEGQQPDSSALVHATAVQGSVQAQQDVAPSCPQQQQQCSPQRQQEWAPQPVLSARPLPAQAAQAASNFGMPAQQDFAPSQQLLPQRYSPYPVILAAAQLTHQIPGLGNECRNPDCSECHATRMPQPPPYPGYVYPRHLQQQQQRYPQRQQQPYLQQQWREFPHVSSAHLLPAPAQAASNSGMPAQAAQAVSGSSMPAQAAQAASGPGMQTQQGAKKSQPSSFALAFAPLPKK